MLYQFEKKENTYHVIFKNNRYELLNTFLQVEGKNFPLEILNCILTFEQTKQLTEFSGNLFTLTLTNKKTSIQNKYDDNYLSIPSNEFIKIFKKYVVLTQK